MIRVFLEEHLDYSVTAQAVASAANRALGLLIAKCKSQGGMPFKCFTRLYEAMVQPIINYGVTVWGTKEFTCINSIQLRASRFYLGTNKFSPNASTYGDMGWQFNISGLV